MKTKPMAMLLMMLAGWINKEQQHMIDYLGEENVVSDTFSGKTGDFKGETKCRFGSF